MAFFEDPRLRQRWNEISYNAEAVTENAAAGIWTFSHNYISPCFASVSEAVESCLTPCLGEPEGRALRAAQRRRRDELDFDFYDDWERDEYGPEFDSGVGIRSGLLASWGGDSTDWDRLLAGTGSIRGRTGQDNVERTQPARKRGMSYGTRGLRRKVSGEQDDPTIIPSTAPLGFLSRLPWNIKRTLRYRPSAADLQEHLGTVRPRPDEMAPLLGGASDDEDGIAYRPTGRKRSGTAGSGDTSDSYRSRGDLFPSDGEGDEDAVPLDDDFTMPLDITTTNDQSSGKSRVSKGKRPANIKLSRTVSRTTIGSTHSKFSTGSRNISGLSVEAKTPSPRLDRKQSSEYLLPGDVDNHDHELERKLATAARLPIAQALAAKLEGEDQRGDISEYKPEKEHMADSPMAPSKPAVYEPTPEGFVLENDAEEEESGAEGYEADGDVSQLSQPDGSDMYSPTPQRRASISQVNSSAASSPRPEEQFIPARLPHFR
ncbi:hypothetical protein MKZ38_005560 [Zalerion maritima]|uniref:Uncharacterized protein n=1 Tax=Zalerion maritima TaxID=339359 RepID=A0AAD5RK48_9PEZI|nr:hypothetical protein MKZ38_005560 [Zalerion maritima]